MRADPSEDALETEPLVSIREADRRRPVSGTIAREASGVTVGHARRWASEEHGMEARLWSAVGRIRAAANFAKGQGISTSQPSKSALDRLP